MTATHQRPAATPISLSLFGISKATIAAILSIGVAVCNISGNSGKEISVALNRGNQAAPA